MSGSYSKPGLERMRETLARHVEAGLLPGLVALLCRRGDVHVEEIGTRASGDRAPMRRDTIFRITSMTKPVTAVAAMILVEECQLRLDEPVDRWLPELADRRVLRRLDGPLDDTVPARRPISLRDLLTFRSGLGSIMQPSKSWPIQQAIDAQAILGFGPPDRAYPHAPDEWMKRLGTLPLMHQPGDAWMYNTGSCVLGVLIARAAGRSFETFLRERIFEPLGMRDTSFRVPAEKQSRLAACCASDPNLDALVARDAGVDWTREPTFPDGAAGLVSTADDYLAFGRMLLDGGRLGSTRILSRSSVRLMTSDQVTREQLAGSGFPANAWDGRGWGFGVSVVTKRNDVWTTPGRFGWDGGYGTAWASDPEEQLVGLLMTQRIGFPLHSPVYLDFWTSAYSALEDRKEP
jgi:CubicO group peptidase (beta-lactamase class C family)